MTTCNVLGIDPGLNGGLLFLSETNEILYKTKMPVRIKNKEGKKEVDFNELKRLLILYKPSMIILEKASPRPLEGVVSAFTSGLNWGAVRAICEDWLQKPITLVSPRVWAAKIHTDSIELVPDPKERSLNVVKKLFPNENFLATLRSRIPHDGIVDACLIAYWWFVAGKELSEKEKIVKVSKKTKKKGKKNVSTKKPVLIQQ